MYFPSDLKSGYHHVDIYVTIPRDVHGETQYYVFAMLPFGLASACYVFIKLLRPLVRYWHGQGLWELLYLMTGLPWCRAS